MHIKKLLTAVLSDTTENVYNLYVLELCMWQEQYILTNFQKHVNADTPSDIIVYIDAHDCRNKESTKYQQKNVNVNLTVERKLGNISNSRDHKIAAFCSLGRPFTVVTGGLIKCS